MFSETESNLQQDAFKVRIDPKEWKGHISLRCAALVSKVPLEPTLSSAELAADIEAEPGWQLWECTGAQLGSWLKTKAAFVQKGAVLGAVSKALVGLLMIYFGLMALTLVAEALRAISAVLACTSTTPQRQASTTRCLTRLESRCCATGGTSGVQNCTSKQ